MSFKGLMDLYFLNFKSILVILSKQDMRINILNLLSSQDIDVNIKFVDSYSEAALLMERNKFNPFDHIVMNLSFSNRKFNDFREYVMPMTEQNPKYLIEYTNDGELAFPEKE